MKKGCKKFPRELKEKVLVASEFYGRSVASIASEYEIPKHTINRWRRERKKLFSHLNQLPEVSKFIELSLEEEVSPGVLEKVSLTFRGVSLIIEGKIKSNSLIGIIKIMEKTC